MAEFAKVAKAGGLAPGSMLAVEIDGRRVALANVEGTLYAIGGVCTHRGCTLAEGQPDGIVVTCPCHGGQLDVTTGQVLRVPPREDVRSLAV